MISLSRCDGVRSMAEWMERSSTDSASLTKMNTMLTSGRLSGNERLRHLGRRMAELLDLLGTPLWSHQVWVYSQTFFSFLVGSGIPVLPKASSLVCKVWALPEQQKSTATESLVISTQKWVGGHASVEQSLSTWSRAS